MSGRRMKPRRPDSSSEVPAQEGDDEDLALPLGQGWRRLRPPAGNDENDENDDGRAEVDESGAAPA